MLFVNDPDTTPGALLKAAWMISHRLLASLIALPPLVTLLRLLHPTRQLKCPTTSMTQRNLGARRLNLSELSVIQLQMVTAATVTTRQMTQWTLQFFPCHVLPVTPIISFSSTVCSPTLYHFQAPSRLPSRTQV